MSLRGRLLSIFVFCALAGAQDVHSQLAPPSSGGLVKFDRLLAQLAENRRVLVVGAHPDDEDSDFLAYTARGLGARTAYLSLTRGEGGQNLIGQELGDGLGLLRTEELLAARSIDGAEQYFTRAYDFGYTRSLDETFQFWNPDSLLKDVVRIVRRFKPDIMVAVFSGTPRDGHGQHQASAVLARRAFEAAGDAARFPELRIEEGLSPWQPTTMFMATRSRVNNADVVLASGSTEPSSGRSYHQIAMAGRSQHRSQDMGRLQQPGPRSTGLLFLESSSGGEASDDMFAGVDSRRDWLSAVADSLRRSAGAAGMTAAVARLADALRRAGDDYVDVRRSRLLQEAFLTAAGVVFDATASTQNLIASDTFTVTVDIYNGGRYPVRVTDVNVDVPGGWSVLPSESADRDLGPGESMTASLVASVSGNARPTEPYFLRTPRTSFLYNWDDVEPELRGTSMQPPIVHARASISALGATATSRREVSFRYNDQAVGEIRRELKVVPALDVKIDPQMLVWPRGREGNPVFTATVRNNSRYPVAGAIELRNGSTRLGASQRFDLGDARGSETFSIEIPAPAAEGDLRVAAVAVADDGVEYDSGVATVDYPHIRAAGFVVPARTLVRAVSLNLPSIGRIGYVRGAADRVPEALAGIGLEVELLSDEQLEQGDLSVYGAIVIGSRAYETNRTLTRFNDRLLEYARNGGRLLVQYQQYQFVRGGYAPYELTIARPHDRVTDENAPVEVIDPGSPAFNFPNPVSGSDWEGWPQERGLYFAHEWADEYRPLLRMSDPDGPPLEGGLLVARYGQGTYTYTGISFFRSLPAGVPGAFRLFLNLVALEAGATP